MDFVFGGGTSGGGINGGGGSGATASGTSGGLSHENGPILYSEPNRTSAIDDIRSVIIYIFIITLFLSFFLILPGIRNEKFPTFLCITTSLIVTAIILVSLVGTTWHVGETPISAAYKAFSRDRIQGELSVKIGLQSVNITLIAHKYYILHATDGPIIMDNSPPSLMSSASTSSSSQIKSIAEGNEYNYQTNSASASSFINQQEHPTSASKAASNLAEELLGGRTSDGITVDTELEVDEVFASKAASTRWTRSSSAATTTTASATTPATVMNQDGQDVKKKLTASQSSTPIARTPVTRNRRQQDQKHADTSQLEPPPPPPPSLPQQSKQSTPKYTVKRTNVDINYNERFYWIEPNQMRHEYHTALERGLPYPILTVVEYLSQDDAGFNWSRQYRAAGYYSSIVLWLSVCVCILMFCLHCAAPKYGIYTMQVLGCLLLFTNLIYFTLVPKGEQKLVIPFEGQSLSLKFGWNFWLVLIGGCLALVVGTMFVIIDNLFPNYIFTTVLDADFDSHHNYYKRKNIINKNSTTKAITNDKLDRPYEHPKVPPFYSDSSSKASALSSRSSRSTIEADEEDEDYEEHDEVGDKINGDNNLVSNHQRSRKDKFNELNDHKEASSGYADKIRKETAQPKEKLNELFVKSIETDVNRSATGVLSQNSESDRPNGGSSVVDMPTRQDDELIGKTNREALPYKQQTRLAAGLHQRHQQVHNRKSNHIASAGQQTTISGNGNKIDIGHHNNIRL